MKMTEQSNLGWMVQNGSGWNHHKTADALNNILASDPNTLPTVPLGYGVLVAPISDKSFGLRCALVRVLPRKMMPSISIHESGGNYIPHPASVQYDHIRLADLPDMESARKILGENSFFPTQNRPAGWPVVEGTEWFRDESGKWASVEMLDDGCEGDNDGWVYDRFDFDGEIVKSCKAEQQSDDDSQYFMRVMAEAISKL